MNENKQKEAGVGPFLKKYGCEVSSKGDMWYYILYLYNKCIFDAKSAIQFNPYEVDEYEPNAIQVN